MYWVIDKNKHFIESPIKIKQPNHLMPLSSIFKSQLQILEKKNHAKQI